MDADELEVQSRQDGPDLAAQNRVAVLARERADKLTLPWVVSTSVIALYSLVTVGVGFGKRMSTSGGVMGAFALVATALAVFAVVRPRTQLTDDILLKQLGQRLETNRWATSMRFDPAQTAQYRGLPESEQRVLALTLLFERPYFEALAATAGVALLGLIHGLLARSVDGAWPFFVAAFALNAWHYPRLARLIDRGRALYRQAEEAAQVRQALAEAQRNQDRRGAK